MLDLKQAVDVRTAPWRIGTYVTDGVRLLCVVAIEGEELHLEDASTECLERWSLREVVTSLRKVAPSTQV
jgi:hypothetical protein